MLTLRLYGEMANKYGKEHILAVRSFPEAMRAMSVNYPGFECNLNAEFCCIKDEEVLTPETLAIQFEDGDLHLIPKIEGDYQAIVVWIAEVLLYTGVSAAAAVAISEVVVFMVVNVALNCLSNLLTSAPESPTTNYGQHESPAKNPSFLFQGAQNKSEQGGGIPIVYGEMMVGSHTVSAEIRMDNTLVIS